THLRHPLLAHFVSSSRRRHTRFSRDWSSDVCSSDLLSTGAVQGVPMLAKAREKLNLIRPSAWSSIGSFPFPPKSRPMSSPWTPEIGRAPCREGGPAG